MLMLTLCVALGAVVAGLCGFFCSQQVQVLCAQASGHCRVSVAVDAGVWSAVACHLRHACLKCSMLQSCTAWSSSWSS